MIEDIFEKLGETFRPGVIKEPAVYYFSIGDVKRTVRVKEDSFEVEEGKTTDNADCVCKTSEEFFLKVWNEGYMPALKDFLGGSIKSNNPSLLKSFLDAFKKE